MLRVAVAAAWLYQLEPEHRLGVTLAPGPTWSRSGCFLHLFFLCFCASVGFCCFPSSAGSLLGARGMLAEPLA